MTASPARIELATDMQPSFGQAEFDFFAKLVYEQSGIVIGPHKKNMMFTRLVRRVRELKLGSFSEYCDHVRGPEGASEIGQLINAMTTNLTRFFREDHHFEYLTQTALPDSMERARHAGNRRLRIWSAGCSSGEEPYSIAITLSLAVPEIRQWDARILATDLDTSMVARGAAGLYPRNSVAEIESERRRAFFDRLPEQPNQMRVSPAIRELITFKPLNLLQPWPMSGPFDAIFCRNVMIYFDNPTKNELVARLTGLLRPGGYLFVGHSETLLDHQRVLKLVGRTIYRRIA